jgi:hypothetical protein
LALIFSNHCPLEEPKLMVIRSTIANHRQFSELAFNPLERVSSCAPKPPDRSSQSARDSETVHTARCLRSIEAQIRLLALPVRPYAHTPFVVCMLATGAISLISACKFLFIGQRLAIARQQIKMSLGFIRSFSRIWSQAATSLAEVQTIAREVLEQPPFRTPPRGRLPLPCHDPRDDRQIFAVVDPEISLAVNACGIPTPLLGSPDTNYHFSDMITDPTWLSGY